MFLKKLAYFIFLSFVVSGVGSQVAVNVDFNACVANDKGSIGSQLTISGNVGCDCGLKGESFDFDGIDDGLTFDQKVNPLFNKDFTIDFYFSSYNVEDVVDILTLSNDCLIDSFFTLQYLPTINSIRFLAKENVSNSIFLDAKIDPARCWHHVSVVRKLYTYFMFIDGKIVSTVDAEKLYTFAPGNRLTISNNPCTLSGQANYRRFRGYFDEFKIYDRALNELELSKSELRSDVILNQDTTIFLGDKIKIDMGLTCADNFSWTGKQDMDNPDILTPTIQPKASQKYHIFFVMRGKSCSDSISIYIQDKDKLDCKNLLLPNSFSPNGDDLNDNYGISNKFIIEELKSFEIFDRWGTRVFQTFDPNSTWDGIYRNEKVNPDKFVYKVKYICKGEEHLKQGVMNLLR
ncbi:MAG: gliding motility-associated C-terminal domain-containing protein [Saprospiraceae bacterium]|nr:gliding motility-associated C-terminal domain-containing protein [Saprospiraceae bacterium]